MANERLPARGFIGRLKALKHFLGTEMGNILKAWSIRRRYGFDHIPALGQEPSPHYGIAIVAIFKGEDEYLREWIEFHRIAGVQHFFLYDNGDSQESRNLLQPYLAEGLVTYLPFPDLPEGGLRTRYGKDQFRRLSMQNLAYGDCALKYASRCDWLVKIDLDEFMYPLEPFASLAEAFASFAKPGVKGFSVLARRFGPSGRRERSALPLIQTYTMRNPEPDRNWKAVARGACVGRLAAYQGCHGYFYRMAPFMQHLSDEHTRGAVQINHYYIKSLAEYLDKIERHSTGHKAGKETADKWPRADESASEKDDGAILRFLPELRSRLAGERS